MKYGDLPTTLGEHHVDCPEMMFYLYLPIKMVGEAKLNYEERLHCFNNLVGASCCNYIGEFGLDKYVNSYVYLTAKHMIQVPGQSYNRPGLHSDGFMTDDIQYFWSNCIPTVFNSTEFKLTMDDSISLKEMIEQYQKENEVTYPDNTLIRINQFNIHRVGFSNKQQTRTFFKLSFSKDKYDLIGNSKNYQLNYSWEMKQRREERNIPQTNIT